MQPIDFLRVRKSALIREIQALGFVYSLIVAAGIFFGLIFFYKLQDSQLHSVYSLAGVSILVAVLHFSRKDHQFIQLVSPHPFHIFFTEYLTLVLPLIILSVAQSGTPIFLLVLIPLLIISLLPVTGSRFIATGFTNKLIPDTNFEWKSGMRKTGGLLILLWLASFALTPVPFASLIALWFALLTVSSFYDDGEPWEMLEAYGMDAKQFLHHKIKVQLQTYLLPVTPVLLISGFIFPERWWVFLLFLIFSSINISVFVLSKYAVWRPAEVNRSASIVNAMCMIGLFLPFLLPLPVFVLIRNYRKAMLNLKPVLHDYH